jgi:hypothetical protein
MTKIAFLGAGGRMGRRICAKLMKEEFDLRCIEIVDEGIAALKEIGLDVTPAQQAVADADAVVFAVPDADVVRITHEIVPQVPTGALAMMLDPCVAHSGKLPRRDDIGYLVSHPCHRSFLEQGEGRRGQHIVIALVQGEERHCELGVEIAKAMYQPVLDVHRLTLDQMVLLEPALSEAVAGACILTIKEGLDEVIKQGVPEKAARDFLLGHVTASLGVVFAGRGFFSDAAWKIKRMGKEMLFRDDWKETLTPEGVRRQVAVALGCKEGDG